MCCSARSICRKTGFLRAMASTSPPIRKISSRSSFTLSAILSHRRGHVADLLLRRQRFDLARRRLNFDVDERAAALGGRPHRITGHTVRLERERSVCKAAEIDSRRMYRHQLGRVGDTRMTADRGGSFALALKEVGLRLVGVIIGYIDHPDPLTQPFLGQP